MLTKGPEPVEINCEEIFTEEYSSKVSVQNIPVCFLSWRSSKIENFENSKAESTTTTTYKQNCHTSSIACGKTWI